MPEDAPNPDDVPALPVGAPKLSPEEASLDGVSNGFALGAVVADVPALKENPVDGGAAAEPEAFAVELD